MLTHFLHLVQINLMVLSKRQVICIVGTCFYILRWTITCVTDMVYVRKVFRYLASLEEQVSSLNTDLVHVGLWSTKGQNGLIGEKLQRPSLSLLIHTHSFTTYSQPQVHRIHTVHTLRQKTKREREREYKTEFDCFC